MTNESGFRGAKFIIIGVIFFRLASFLIYIVKGFDTSFRIMMGFLVGEIDFFLLGIFMTLAVFKGIGLTDIRAKDYKQKFVCGFANAILLLLIWKFARGFAGGFIRGLTG